MGLYQVIVIEHYSTSNSSTREHNT